MNFWQRLSKLKLQSIERRTERFLIFYTWKSIMNIVPSLGFEIWSHPRKGKMIRNQKMSCKSQAMRSVKEKSIYGQGPKIFNSLPQCIREWEGSFMTFKFIVDNFLTLIPDKPCMKGYNSENHDLYGNLTNSIVHWVRNLDLTKWEHRTDQNAALCV